jgi:hypothetical protein
MTVGAKALVVSEKKSKEEALLSSDEEAAAKSEMKLEADTRLFKRDMSLPPGVPVLKMGENGKSRKCFIQFAVLKSGAYGIAWKSAIIGSTKTFDLSSVVDMKTTSVDRATAAQQAPSSNNTMNSNGSNSSNSGSMGEADEVILENSEKKVHFKFSSVHQRRVFAYAVANIAHL